MSLPRNLSHSVLTRIREHWSLHEITGPDQGPRRTLTSAQRPDPVGELRVYTGAPLRKLVYIALVVPPIGLDSHMLFAFTPEGSAVPHFTLDAVAGHGAYALHLDLVPRVDLAANLAYMDAVYTPLTETTLAVRGRAGLGPAQITPRQWAVMSPWMLVHRADEAAFAALDGPVHTYLEHWIGLLDRGLDPAVLADLHAPKLEERDARLRAALFNPAVDPVWNNVARLVGEEAAAALREELKS